MLFDVEVKISIPGIPTFFLVRSVDATSARDALDKAERDICLVQTTSVMVNTTGAPVLPDPTVIGKK